MRAYHPCPPAVMALKTAPGIECLADRTSEQQENATRVILLRELSTGICSLYLYTPTGGVHLAQQGRNRGILQQTLEEYTHTYLNR